MWTTVCWVLIRKTAGLFECTDFDDTHSFKIPLSMCKLFLGCQEKSSLEAGHELRYSPEEVQDTPETTEAGPRHQLSTLSWCMFPLVSYHGHGKLPCPTGKASTNGAGHPVSWCILLFLLHRKDDWRDWSAFLSYIRGSLRPHPNKTPYPQHEESRHQAVLRQLIRIEGVIGKAKKSAAELLARHAMEMMYPLVN